jgi:hypothetical protein
LSHVRTIVPCRPNGRTSTACNFHIKASRIRTKGMVVRTVDLMHAISISNDRASGPWRLVSGRLDFECNTCLMNERVRTGIHILQTVAAIFPYLCFGRKSYSWSNTECRPDVLLKHPDGCKLEQLKSFSIQRKVRTGSSRRPDEWCFEQLDVRMVYHVVWTAVRNLIFLTCRLYRIFWKHSE